MIYVNMYRHFAFLFQNVDIYIYNIIKKVANKIPLLTNYIQDKQAYSGK